jgi:hypothetical protein
MKTELANYLNEQAYRTVVEEAHCAVNAHDALIKACELALANLSPTYASDHIVIKSLRAALWAAAVEQ